MKRSVFYKYKRRGQFFGGFPNDGVGGTASWNDASSLPTLLVKPQPAPDEKAYVDPESSYEDGDLTPQQKKLQNSDTAKMVDDLVDGRMRTDEISGDAKDDDLDLNNPKKAAELKTRDFDAINPIEFTIKPGKPDKQTGAPGDPKIEGDKDFAEDFEYDPGTGFSLKDSGAEDDEKITDEILLGIILHYDSDFLKRPAAEQAWIIAMMERDSSSPVEAEDYGKKPVDRRKQLVWLHRNLGPNGQNPFIRGAMAPSGGGGISPAQAYFAKMLPRRGDKHGDAVQAFQEAQSRFSDEEYANIAYHAEFSDPATMLAYLDQDKKAKTARGAYKKKTELEEEAALVEAGKAVYGRATTVEDRYEQAVHDGTIDMASDILLGEGLAAQDDFEQADAINTLITSTTLDDVGDLDGKSIPEAQQVILDYVVSSITSDDIINFAALHGENISDLTPEQMNQWKPQLIAARSQYLLSKYPSSISDGIAIDTRTLAQSLNTQNFRTLQAFKAAKHVYEETKDKHLSDDAQEEYDKIQNALKDLDEEAYEAIASGDDEQIEAALERLTAALETEKEDLNALRAKIQELSETFSLLNFADEYSHLKSITSRVSSDALSAEDESPAELIALSRQHAIISDGGLIDEQKGHIKSADAKREAIDRYLVVYGELTALKQQTAKDGLTATERERLNSLIATKEVELEGLRSYLLEQEDNPLIQDVIYSRSRNAQKQLEKLYAQDIKNYQKTIKDLEAEYKGLESVGHYRARTEGLEDLQEAYASFYPELLDAINNGNKRKHEKLLNPVHTSGPDKGKPLFDDLAEFSITLAAAGTEAQKNNHPLVKAKEGVERALDISDLGGRIAKTVSTPVGDVKTLIDNLKTAENEAAQERLGEIRDGRQNNVDLLAKRLDPENLKVGANIWQIIKDLRGRTNDKSSANQLAAMASESRDDRNKSRKSILNISRKEDAEIAAQIAQAKKNDTDATVSQIRAQRSNDGFAISEFERVV